MVIGVPSVVQHSTISIGQLFIQNLVNSFGEDVVAGYGAAQKINLFTISLIMTFGNALSVFVSQNIGAGTNERIKDGIKAATFMNGGVGVGDYALCSPTHRVVRGRGRRGGSHRNGLSNAVYHHAVLCVARL